MYRSSGRGEAPRGPATTAIALVLLGVTVLATAFAVSLLADVEERLTDQAEELRREGAGEPAPPQALEAHAQSAPEPRRDSP